MEYLLDLFTIYSNLILVIITGVYAYLTGRMVREMKTARENQTDSNLVTTPVLAHRIYAEIQLVNAGPEAALDVKLSISLEPLLETVVKTWHHPSLLVGQKENFFLPMANPSTSDSLCELADKHNSVKVRVKWNNIFGKHKSFSASYNLNDLAQGWYNAGHLIPPDDIPSQMQKITKSLDEIHDDIEQIGKGLNPPDYLNTVETKSNTKPKASRKKKVSK